MHSSSHLFMQHAINEAQAALLSDEVPVGAIIISPEKKIISKAHNNMKTSIDPTAHAECLAIREACKILKQERLEGFDIYVTLEPCPMCAQAISMARINALYFGAYDLKGGGVEHGPRIFHSSSCHHKPEIYGGIAEAECSSLMKDFFRSKRQVNKREEI